MSRHLSEFFQNAPKFEPHTQSNMLIVSPASCMKTTSNSNTR